MSKFLEHLHSRREGRSKKNNRNRKKNDFFLVFLSASMTLLFVFVLGSAVYTDYVKEEFVTDVFVADAAPSPPAPEISLLSPTAPLLLGTTETDLIIKTEDSANCKYSTATSSATILNYSLMSDFDITGDVVHIKHFSGLADNQFYRYFIKCQDSDDISEDFTVEFSVDTDELWGWAWSSNVGWISFNSKNCDLDNDGEYEGASEGDSQWSPATAPPTDCPTSGNAFRYAVTMDRDTGNLGGYAWNDNVGWISFASSSVPGGVTNNYWTADCDASCTIANDCTACVNIDDEKIYGGAIVLSLGDDGWLQFDDDNIGDTTVYGLEASSTESAVFGFAWNENGSVGGNKTGIGWVSFNSDYKICDLSSVDAGKMCNSDLDCPSGLCVSNGSPAYAVTANFNRPPTVSSFELFPFDYCSNSALSSRPTWVFDDPDAGDTQVAYQLIVDDDNDISSPLFDTGKCDEFNVNPDCVASYDASAFLLHTVYTLDYDDEYFYWVRVWDNNGGVSAFAGSISSTTPENEYPEPYFSWFSPDPSAKEEVKFFDESIHYSSGLPDVSVDCDIANCSYLWEDDVPVNFGNTPTASSTIYLIPDQNSFDVNLTVTDDSGYFCSTSTTMQGIKKKLPTWEEAK